MTAWYSRRVCISIDKGVCKYIIYVKAPLVFEKFELLCVMSMKIELIDLCNRYGTIKDGRLLYSKMDVFNVGEG